MDYAEKNCGHCHFEKNILYSGLLVTISVSTQFNVMTAVFSPDQELIHKWLADKLEPAAIEQELTAGGLDAESIKAYIKEFRKVRNSKKLTTGFICMAIGAFLGFVSCVLTLANPFPELYNVILYGLTSVSILVIMLGLYFVFE